MTTTPSIPYTLVPRMRLIGDVLERAKDVSDALVVSACGRLIIADRLGWQNHHDPADWALVKQFGEAECGEVPFPE
jgi:hypothetical protein